MTGKGDEIRPYDRKKYNDNFDRIFKNRDKKTAVSTIYMAPFEVEGDNITLDDIYQRIKDLMNARQLAELRDKRTTRYDWSHNIYLFIPVRFIPSYAIGNCTNRVYN